MDDDEEDFIAGNITLHVSPDGLSVIFDIQDDEPQIWAKDCEGALESLVAARETIDQLIKAQMPEDTH